MGMPGLIVLIVLSVAVLVVFGALMLSAMSSKRRARRGPARNRRARR